MTILNEYIDANWGLVSYLFILLAAILFVITVYVLIIDLINKDQTNASAFFFFFVVACVVLAFVYVEKVPTYEVLLDNEYTAKEFFDSYIFIEKKGDIYVVREIEKEEEK